MNSTIHTIERLIEREAANCTTAEQIMDAITPRARVYGLDLDLCRRMAEAEAAARAEQIDDD